MLYPTYCRNLPEKQKITDVHLIDRNCESFYTLPDSPYPSVTVSSIPHATVFHYFFPPSLLSSLRFFFIYSQQNSNWWKNNKKERSIWFNGILQEAVTPPEQIEPWITRKLVNSVLYAPAIFAFFTLEDLYGVHFTLEDNEVISLDKLKEDDTCLCGDLRQMVNASGRI